MAFLIGIDVGTSSTKALICDRRGKVVATASAPHTLLTPKPGWTEQDPDEWWAATITAVRGAVRKAKLKPADIVGIGLSGQMHGSVFLDRAGRPIRNALLWNDQRTVQQAQQVLERVGGERRMLELVGNLPLTGYTLPKLLWLRDAEPKRFAKLAKLLMPKDYIAYRLTGVQATDVSEGSGSAMLDVRSRQWSSKLLDALKLDDSILPSVHESSDVIGELLPDVAKALGLKAGTPVVTGGGDVMTAAVGGGIVEPGLMSVALGTSGVVCAHADQPAIDDAGPTPGRVATMCSAVPGKWVVYGCMLSAAGSVQWFADEFAGPAKRSGNVFAELLDLAATAPLGCEGLYFLPYLTGERCPYPNPAARGAWIGLTRRTGRAACMRAVLEGVTYNLRAILQILRDLQLPARQMRLSGGGARNAFWRQMQADVFNAPATLTNSAEGSAYGAALLGGVGAGVWPTVEAACRATIRVVETSKPNAARAREYAEHAAIFDRLYADLRGSFAAIAAME